MARVRELLTNGELSQWCGRQAARGNSMQKPPVAVRATTRKKRDQREWLQAGVPALRRACTVDRDNRRGYLVGRRRDGLVAS